MNAARPVFIVVAAFACYQALQAGRRRRVAARIAALAEAARKPLSSTEPASPPFTFTCRAEPGPPPSPAFS